MASGVNGAVNGIHDVGGMDGFGPVVHEPDEPVFHARWEARVFAIASLLLGRGVTNLDAFRHAIERLPPVVYLTAGYYGRWLAAVETLLVESGVASADELARGAADPGATIPALGAPSRGGARREVGRAPRFAVGDRVVARNVHPAGHTRLPRYVRGRRGVVVRVHPAWVFPDTNAHGRGEAPQHAYAVGFDARQLWGEDADPRVVVHVDVFESQLAAER
jgi:nitrile hydratase